MQLRCGGGGSTFRGVATVGSGSMRGPTRTKPATIGTSLKRNEFFMSTILDYFQALTTKQRRTVNNVIKNELMKSKCLINIISIVLICF